MLERDVGYYDAVASNEHGEARQRVRLEIAEYPRFLKRPSETYIMSNRNGRIEARVIGVPGKKQNFMFYYKLKLHLYLVLFQIQKFVGTRIGNRSPTVLVSKSVNTIRISLFYPSMMLYSKILVCIHVVLAM